MTARTVNPSRSRRAVSRSASSRVRATIRIAARDVSLDADLKDLLHERVDPRGIGTVLASRVGQIGRSQENHTDPRHIENLVQMFDAGQCFDLQHRHQRPGRIERPDIGTRRPPDTHRVDGGQGLCLRLDIGEHHTQHTGVEHLLDHPLRRVSRREGNPHDRCDGGRRVACPYRNHGLANRSDLEIAVLFVDDREVEVGAGGACEGANDRPPLLQSLDDAIDRGRVLCRQRLRRHSGKRGDTRGGTHTGHRLHGVADHAGRGA